MMWLQDTPAGENSIVADVNRPFLRAANVGPKRNPSPKRWVIHCGTELALFPENFLRLRDHVLNRESELLVKVLQRSGRAKARASDDLA